MSPKSLRLFSCLVLCMGIASVLFFLYEVAGRERVFTSITIFPLAPYLVAFIPALLPQARFGAVIVLIGCVLLVGVSACIYYYVFFVETGSYNGLYFFLLPAVQLAFCLVLLIWAGIASMASAPKNNTRPA